MRRIHRSGGVYRGKPRVPTAPFRMDSTDVYRGKPGCGEIRFAEWGEFTAVNRLDRGAARGCLRAYRGKPGAEQCAGYTGVGEFTAVNQVPSNAPDTPEWGSLPR